MLFVTVLMVLISIKLLIFGSFSVYYCIHLIIKKGVANLDCPHEHLRGMDYRRDYIG